MFNEYYYTNEFEEPIYFSIITLNNSVETSLYIGNKLVRRKSLQRGIHQLIKNEVSLKIQIKWFKAIPKLRVNNQLVEAQKLKRKQLRVKLAELGITNEINPKILPKEPYNYRKLIVPLILITIGVIWGFLTDGRGKFWDIPAMLLFLIAYIQLFGGLIEKVSDRHMNSETKGKLKLIIGVAGMIFTQILIEKIINLTI